MKRGEDSDSIPVDLVLEILSRLPAKSAGRFCCVSKLWGSMIWRPYFTELFLTRSLARPRLLFALEHNGLWRFFSLPQTQNPYEKSSSLVQAADCHMIRGNMYRDFCGCASGLIYFPAIEFPEEHVNKRFICNPITGQYATLPKLKRHTNSYSFLGFDPIDKQFKVLCGGSKILTLSTGNMWWRKIHCPIAHEPMREGICINGILYYLAKQSDHVKIASFDVRSEKFRFIETKSFCAWRTTLMNYKGKLGVIKKYGVHVLAADTELRIWVLEDVEKHEWSRFVYTLPKNGHVHWHCVSVVGVTSRGEIVLSNRYAYKTFYVFYFNPQRKTLQTVEVQCIGANHEAFEFCFRVHTFVDYVEDLKFIT